MIPKWREKCLSDKNKNTDAACMFVDSQSEVLFSARFQSLQPETELRPYWLLCWESAANEQIFPVTLLWLFFFLFFGFIVISQPSCWRVQSISLDMLDSTERSQASLWKIWIYIIWMMQANQSAESAWDTTLQSALWIQILLHWFIKAQFCFYTAAVACN